MTRVLVVDDQRIAREYMENVLKTGQFSSQLFTQEGYCLRQVSANAWRFFSACPCASM